MHARDAKLALVVDALTPLVPGEIRDNTAQAVSAINSGTIPTLPVICVVPGREVVTRLSQGTGSNPPLVHRTLPIEITVIAASRAQLSETLASVEAAIPWDDASGNAQFEVGDTTHVDRDAGNRALYVSTLTVLTKYQTGLGQSEA